MKPSDCDLNIQTFLGTDGHGYARLVDLSAALLDVVQILESRPACETHDALRVLAAALAQGAS